MHRKPDPLLCLVFFVAGALLPLPGYLVLAGLWVRGIQASVLLASLVCLIAASSPWWVDWLEQRRIDAVLRERAAAPYGWTSAGLPEDFRKGEQAMSADRLEFGDHETELTFEQYRAEAWGSDPEDHVSPFPQEPAFGSREAVERAANSLRGPVSYLGKPRAYPLNENTADLLAEVERVNADAAAGAWSAAEREMRLVEQRDELADALARSRSLLTQALGELDGRWYVAADVLPGTEIKAGPVFDAIDAALRKAGRWAP